MKIIMSITVALLFALAIPSFNTAAYSADNDAPAAQTTKTEVVYHGNARSHKFHRPGCQHYNCPNCTAVFKTKKDAVDAGYVPCKVCNP